MAPEELTVGLAGPAEECCTLLRAFSELRGEEPFRIRALATGQRADPGLSEALAELAPEASVYTRVEDLLANETLKVLCVATPLALRSKHAASALHHGLHVLLRMPPALTIRAARRLLKASEQTGRTVCVYRSGRFSHRAQVLRWAVSSGRIGSLQFLLDAAFGLPGAAPQFCVGRDPKHHARLHGGGLLLQRAVRELGFLRYVCGEVVDVVGSEFLLEPERLVVDPHGTVLQRFAAQGEDTVGAFLRFANGAGGLYLRSWCGHGATLAPLLCLWGNRGCIQGSDLYTGTGCREPVEQLFRECARPEELGQAFPGASDPVALEVRAFLKELRSGESPRRGLPHGLREALRDLSVAWAIAEAHTGGRRVTVAEVENLQVEAAQSELNTRWKFT